MLSNSVTEATLTASRALVGVAARSVADALELVTLPQFRTLVVLAGAGQLRVGELAAKVHAHPSTFSRSLDRMVTGGWVERLASPGSRREVLVRLSPAGRALVDEVTERRRRELSRILSKLTAEEQLSVLNAFELFARAAEEIPAEDLLTLGL